MANTILPDFEKLINEQVDVLEILSEKISKAMALAFMVRQAEFDEVPKKIQHDYFWTLTDYLTDALEYNETQLKELIRNLPKKNLGEGSAI